MQSILLILLFLPLVEGTTFESIYIWTLWTIATYLAKFLFVSVVFFVLFRVYRAFHLAIWTQGISIQNGNKLLNILDSEEVDIDDEEIAEAGHLATAGNTRFVRNCARVIRVEANIPIDSPANRLVVRRMIRDLLKERRVRPAHMLDIVTLVEALVFIPTKLEVNVRWAIQAPKVVDRITSYDMQSMNLFALASRFLGYPSLGVSRSDHF
jgi:hypothetical protein